MTMHEREIRISEDAARTLIVEQFPRWADEPIRRVRSSGTVNAIFRIGEQFAARFPLLGDDPAETRDLLVREAAASAEFVRHSPFPAPVPIGLGVPGHGYPLPWSVQSWIAGTVATDDDPSTGDSFARDLATLVAALRGVDTLGRTFKGPGRGGDLTDHDAWVEECLRNSAHLLEVPLMESLWRHFRDLPRASPDVMTHGDLIPANVLVKDMRLAGVLDCGGFAARDPALDVIAGWHLLDEGSRSLFRTELGCDDLEWERSKAWAFEQAIGAVWYYADSNPAMSSMGRRTLARIVATCPAG